MRAVNEMLDEQTVVADSTPGKIVLPSDVRGRAEWIWYGITPPVGDIRLVKVGETQGQIIKGDQPSNVWGPYRVAAVLAGNAPQALHDSAGPTNVQVVVYLG